MFAHAVFCGSIMVFHCLLISTYASPVKLENYSGLGDLEYVLKRTKEEAVNDQDSKERRSNVGSSFVRFGRSRKSLYGEYDQGQDYPMDHPQTRSDVIIRYGRSDKNKQKLRRSDSQFIRFGRNIPLEKDLHLICNNISIEENSLEQILHLYPLELVRICEALDKDRLNVKTI